MEEKKKFKLHMPHVLTLIFFLIIVVAILTWILPSGEFERKPANKKSSVFLKKISKIRFDILCITFKPPEMPALKVVI